MTIKQKFLRFGNYLKNLVNYFNLLNIKEDATLKEIKDAYITLKNDSNNKDNAVLLSNLSKAYQILSKDNLKELYLKKIENIKKVKQNFQEVKIEYSFKNDNERNNLILCAQYIEFNGKKLKVEDIDFINIKIVKQSSGLLNSGDRYFFNIGTKTNKFNIVMDNKLNVGNDIIFEDVVDVALIFYKKIIIEKIHNKLKEKKHYNLTEKLEITPKGIVITNDSSNTVIPIENLECVTTYNTLVIKNNKKNLEYFFDDKDNLINHLMLPFIFKENVDDDLSIEEEIYDENNNNNDNESKSFLMESAIIKEHKKEIYAHIGENFYEIKELMNGATDDVKLEVYNKYTTDENKKYVSLEIFIKLYKQKLRSYMRKKEKKNKILEEEKLKNQKNKTDKLNAMKQNIVILAGVLIAVVIYLFIK